MQCVVEFVFVICKQVFEILFRLINFSYACKAIIKNMNCWFSLCDSFALFFCFCIKLSESMAL